MANNTPQINTQQKKYALERIEQLKNIKIQEATEKFKIEGKKLSTREKAILIYSNKVKLIPLDEIEKISNINYIDLIDSYDFSKYEKDSGYKEGYEQITASIINKSQEAKDEIMLGDCERALALIHEIETLKI